MKLFCQRRKNKQLTSFVTKKSGKMNGFFRIIFWKWFHFATMTTSSFLRQKAQISVTWMFEFSMAHVVSLGKNNKTMFDLKIDKIHSENCFISFLSFYFLFSLMIRWRRRQKEMNSFLRSEMNPNKQDSFDGFYLDRRWNRVYSNESTYFVDIVYEKNFFKILTKNFFEKFFLTSALILFDYLSMINRWR